MECGHTKFDHSFQSSTKGSEPSFAAQHTKVCDADEAAIVDTRRNYAFQSVSLGDALANFTMSVRIGGVRYVSLLKIKRGRYGISDSFG